MPMPTNMLRTDPKFRKLLEEYKNNSFKLKNDPRITQVGKFIRKHSLDEIPQIINVLRGEMSLVGPRAYYPDELSDQQRNSREPRLRLKRCLKLNRESPGVASFRSQ